MSYMDEHGRPIYEVEPVDNTRTITGDAYLGDHYADGFIYTRHSIVGDAYLSDHVSDGSIVIRTGIVGDAYLPDHYADGQVNVATLLFGDAYLPDHYADGSIGIRISIVGDTYLSNHYADGAIAALLSITGDAYLTDHYADGSILLVVPETYATWLFNTKNFAHSRYGSEFAFNSLFELNGIIYGCGGSTAGIHKITGKLDGTTAISASVTWGVSDFGKSNKKTAIDANIACRADGNLTFSTINDEDTLTDYTVIVDTTKQGIHTERTGSLAKGLKKRYWQPKLANVSGSDFDLIELEMNVQDLSRTA